MLRYDNNRTEKEIEVLNGSFPFHPLVDHDSLKQRVFITEGTIQLSSGFCIIEHKAN